MHAQRVEGVPDLRDSLVRSTADHRRRRRGLDRAERMQAVRVARHGRIGVAAGPREVLEERSPVRNGMSHAITRRARPGAAPARCKSRRAARRRAAIRHDLAHCRRPRRLRAADEHDAAGTPSRAASWRSRMRTPPTTSALLSWPPRRRACPPARMCASSNMPDQRLEPFNLSEFQRMRDARHRARARGRTASGHRRPAADAAGVLRELVQPRRVCATGRLGWRRSRPC